MPRGGDGTRAEVWESWSHARLMPTFGIRSQQEREKRATSLLLAVMHGVPEFGHALLKELGAPKASVIETFAEVRFKTVGRPTVIPDGAIHCRWAGKDWTCLVEVKTGSAHLRAEQVLSYLDVAKAHGFDGVLTISTQITAGPFESPIVFDGRKPPRNGPGLWHLSWWRVLTEAIVQQRYRGVSNSDQEWVLRELIHYLTSPASGAIGFEDMGTNWVKVRTAVRNQSFRKSDGAGRDVADRWEQFTQYLCLRLTQELGVTVTAPRPRAQTSSARLDELVDRLASSGELWSTVRVPDAIGPLTIRADLRSRQTFLSVTFDAPREGMAKTRFNWLIRQLKHAPHDLSIKTSFANVRESTVVKLGDVREDPSAALCPGQPKRPPRAFTLTLAKPMGQKRGRAKGSFVRETALQTTAFYHDIVQNLKPWHAPAPRLQDAEQLDMQADFEDEHSVVLAGAASDGAPNSGAAPVGDDQ